MMLLWLLRFLARRAFACLSLRESVMMGEKQHNQPRASREKHSSVALCETKFSAPRPERGEKSMCNKVYTQLEIL